MASAQTYRKKPVEIEAWHLALTENPNEIARWCGGRVAPHPEKNHTGGPVVIRGDIRPRQLDQRPPPMARRASKVCSTPGCPEVVASGRCPTCTQQAEQRRGTARQRGYDSRHEHRFRKQVLAAQPVCQLCGRDWSTDADHHPVDRQTLVLRGEDPNNPKHGRGLCHRCHSVATAEHQPGGWNAR